MCSFSVAAHHGDKGTYTENLNIKLSVEQQYQVAKTNIALVERSNPEFLMVRGKDAIDLLNRISTNDLANLGADEVRSTILTTEKGRFLDLITIIPQENSYFLEVSSGNKEKIFQWLNKYIITEEVEVEILSSSFFKCTLLGPQVYNTLSGLISESNIEPNRIRRVNLEGNEVFLFQDPLFLDYAWNIYSRTKHVEIFSKLVNALIINSDVFEIIRIERRVPIFGKELTIEINPLEAGLKRFISFTKGCYLGQEVIARLDTYDKLQRRLIGFAGKLDGVAVGDDILVNEKNVGWVTSITYSPVLGQWIALGYAQTSVRNSEIVIKSTKGIYHSVSTLNLS